MGHIASLPINYPARVLNTTLEECPSDDHQEAVRSEVGQAVNSILRSYISCPDLTNPENGQVVQALDGNVPGTVANYSCDAGYALLQRASRDCARTGLEVVWTGEAPTCHRKP